MKVEIKEKEMKRDKEERKYYTNIQNYVIFLFLL